MVFPRRKSLSGSGGEEFSGAFSDGFSGFMYFLSLGAIYSENFPALGARRNRQYRNTARLRLGPAATRTRL